MAVTNGHEKDGKVLHAMFDTCYATERLQIMELAC